MVALKSIQITVALLFGNLAFPQGLQPHWFHWWIGKGHTVLVIFMPRLFSLIAQDVKKEEMTLPWEITVSKTAREIGEVWEGQTVQLSEDRWSRVYSEFG